MVRCPLCRDGRAEPREQAHGRRFLRCPVCSLVFLDPAQRLDAVAERAHYDTHENDPADPRYRGFLSRLADPLIQRLTPGAAGLDYGSGPGPTLSVMLQERGFDVRLFDPFFASDPAVLDRTYDFISLTEVAEHFFAPRDEFDRMERMLRPGGWLALMTEVLREDQALASWRYARDPTHVCFYAPDTLCWIAEHYGWTLEAPRENVALFQKPGATRGGNGARR